MIAGIDLGTSAVKILCINKEGTVAKARYRYRENTVQEWLYGIRSAFKELEGQEITAIALSSQVGTYVTEDRIFSWRNPGGEKELESLLKEFTEEEFLEEISMVHPSLLSYPIPRIDFIQKQTDHPLQKICQPKEVICQYLTGSYVSDPYSYRGLANQQKGTYSQKFMEYLHLSGDALPELVTPFTRAGILQKEAAVQCGLKEGIPVYTGCNDYYASLLGMGVKAPGDCFDVTGTSEHLGMITEELLRDQKVIASPYFNGCVAYGVTASSGASLDLGLRELNLARVSYEIYRNKKNLPLFLPYVNGERAPIYDMNARGVFFGIQADTTREDMAYAIMEGVAFSTWHIMENLPYKTVSQVICAGGAAGNRDLMQLKADLFGLPFVRAREEDTSAYGACMIGAVGEDWYPDMENAVEALCSYDPPVQPQRNPRLRERFALYKKIYTDLKKDFELFRRTEQ